MNALFELISKQPFFEGISKEHLEILVQNARVEAFHSHESIFEVGTDARQFYLIVRGEVSLHTHFSPGIGNAGLQTLGPGDPIGWSWFFPPRTWQFAAKAKTDVDIIVFDGLRLRQAADENHSFGYDLAKRIGIMLGERLELTRNRMLQAYKPPF